MQCPQCQHENPAEMKFCGECGASLAPSCSACGASNPPTNKFCGKCGASLAQTEPATRFAAPESYTPRHLAEKILTSRSVLEGERKHVTVLFCDIANSTALAERVGPEAMHTILNRFFGLALAEVHRYEGTINQFLGDGFMALFGAPVAHEDHARRAVLGALGIQRAMRDNQPPGPGVELSVRIGLNTGPVVVGKIGDNLRMDYTAVGDTTNLAARLQQLAQPGTILVSGAVRRLVHGYMRLEPLEPVSIKGKTEPVSAHRVLGIGSRRSSVEGLEDRALSPFVGRDHELAALKNATAQVLGGRGQVVGVVGEAGVGKSRLVYEFRQGLAGLRVTYLEGRCLSYGRSIPYLPVLDIVRANCGIIDSDTPELVAGKLRAALKEVGMEPEPALPYLLQFLGVKEGTEAIAAIGPETIKARTFECIRQLSLNGSRRRPIIFAVEDLHWIDKTSEEFLASLVESMAGAPILLLTTYRPGYRPPWLEQSYATQLSVHPLSLGHSRIVVHSVLALAEATEPLVERVLQKGEGNPFFLEELAKSVGEHSDVRGSQLPDTIQGVLLARIDRLSDPSKELLQTAAVVGREVPLRVLREVWDGAARLDPLLSDLKRQEFLYEQSGAELVYVFKHVLTQETAYEGLLSPRRQVLHEATARALETLYAHRLPEYYGLLAHHHSRSTNTDKALDYLDLANQKAAKANALVEAKQYFAVAMGLLDVQPDTDAYRRRRMALLTRQLIVFWLSFEVREYYALSGRYEAAAVASADPALLGMFYAARGWCEWWFARFDECIRTEVKAAELCEAAGNSEGAAIAYTCSAWAHLCRGNYGRVLALKEHALERLDQSFGLRWYLWALSAASWACTFLGRWEEAERAAQIALDASEELGDASAVSFAAWILAFASFSKEDLERAISYAELSIRNASTPADEAWAHGALAAAWCHVGDPLRGADALAPLIPASRAVGLVWAEVVYSVYLGEGYWRAGKHENAKTTLEAALQAAEPAGIRFFLGAAHRLMGEILSENSGATGAETAAAHFTKSFEILDEIKAENELALAYAGYGRLNKRRGRIAEARDHLTRALEIFERLGTLIEPDKIRADLAELPAS